MYEITMVANSGKDVPIAKTVIPITVSETPKDKKILRELSKNNFPPINSPKNDNNKYR